MEKHPAISSDLIRGHIDTIILHALLDGDKFAQQISDAVEMKSGSEYKINQATLYSSLKRLESLKLVSSYWHDYEDGRRKYFKITDSGKDTVETNLSSWTYSRSIIDKLMDLSPSAVFKVVNPISAPKDEMRVESVEEKIIYNDEKSEPEKIETNSGYSNGFASDTPKTTENEDKTVSSEHERNFRNILNGLIEVNRKEPHKADELQPIVFDDASDQKNDKTAEGTYSDVLKFNETIDETDYNANSVNYNGKIDCGDLTLKAEREGYVIRISSKDSAKPKGKILINKMNFAVSALIFIVCLIEFAALIIVDKAAFSSTPVIIVCALAPLPLIFFGIRYFGNKGKLSGEKITVDSILTAAIIAFNLILVNFALTLLFDVDFSDKIVLFAAAVIPVMYYADIVLFCWIKYVFASKKKFSVK